MELLAGGLSASAACVFTNPLEVVKNRLQLQGELRSRGEYVKMYKGPLQGLVVMARTDGLVALQAGLGPAMLYQFVMNGLRLGTYASLESHGWTRDGPSGQVSPTATLLCSAVSGVVGGFLGSPLFLVKTHLQTSSSSSISVGHQHHHGGFVSGLTRVYKAGGLAGLWQGATASIPRISIGSAAQLVTYSLVTERLSEMSWFRSGRDWQINLVGAFLSGFVVALAINPLDVVATRLYNQPAGLDRFYRGYGDCVVKLAVKEGPLAFFKGLSAQYLRIGPHSFISLFLWHHCRKHFDLL